MILKHVDRISNQITHKNNVRDHRSSRAIRLEVSQRLPPIA